MKKVKDFLKENWQISTIIIVSFFLMTLRLGRDYFWDWDECLYTVYARTMHQTGNFLNNQWNGFTDLQKPPLYTWILQIPQNLFNNEFGFRLFSLIAGLTLVALVYFFSKKYFSKLVGITASLLLLVSEVVVIFMRRIDTDIGFTLFIFAGVWLWLSSFKKNYLSYVSGVFFALAVMIKGISVVQFLFPLFLMIFFDPKKEKFLNFFKLISVFVVLIIPWHLLAYLKYGKDFLQVYVYENLIQRANNPIEFHYGGKLYYLKQIYQELYPWIFFAVVLPLNYIFSYKKFLSLKSVKKEFERNQVLFTVILLIIIPLLFLTKAQTKLPWYAMPTYPFIAIYLAYNIELLVKKVNLKVLAPLILILLALDSFNLISHDAKLFQSKRDLSPQNAVAIAASKIKQNEINFLVNYSERRANDLLNQAPNLAIKSTRVYGGNPCAVYYSNKKVNYFYDPDKFVRTLEQKKGFFIVENGDLHYVEKIHKRILYSNLSYALFEVI